MKPARIVVIGGGAAGFFGAIQIAQSCPNAEVQILERGKDVLQKVKISGGGRCNLTHACFDPRELTQYYPRGKKELLGPFHKFACGDTIGWFGDRGVETKIEEDGRMFPISDSSQTIIDCLVTSAKNAGVKIKLKERVENLFPPNDDSPHWRIKTKDKNYLADYLMICSGSNPKIWDMLDRLGHNIISPVPSLFTFNTKDTRLRGLSGLSVPQARLQIPSTKLSSQGPLLITHWGLSGPAILKLSAWGARSLNEQNYKFELIVNWLNQDREDILQEIQSFKKEKGKQQITKRGYFELPARLWQSFCQAAKIPDQLQWANLNKNQTQALIDQLIAGRFQITGKSTFKEEFVTAGGIDLNEVDFRSFKSKVLPNLYFAGEVLNIDAITGGFNFQAAWTGSWIAGQSIAQAIQ